MRRILIGYTSFNDSDYIANLINNYFSDKKYKILLINLDDYLSSEGKIKINIYGKANKNAIINSVFHSITNKLKNIKHIIKLFDSDSLRERISDFNPDMILSTHFFVNNIFAYYKKEGIIMN